MCVVSKDSTFLIDCGSADNMINAGEIAAGELMSSGRQTVDCLILTHLRKDHTNGVETLCELMEVKKIILPRYNSDSDNMLCTIKQIADVHNIELIYIENDCKISVENCSLLLFAPGEDDSDDENEKCLFVNVRIGDFSALITGDSPMSYEEKLINRFDIGQIDLLVVGHHGSRYSTSPQLLYRLSPEYAVISTGYNSYGHPTYETLNRLDYYKCKVYRTDINDDFIMKIG